MGQIYFRDHTGETDINDYMQEILKDQIGGIYSEDQTGKINVNEIIKNLNLSGANLINLSGLGPHSLSCVMKEIYKRGPPKEIYVRCEGEEPVRVKREELMDDRGNFRYDGKMEEITIKTEGGIMNLRMI